MKPATHTPGPWRVTRHATFLVKVESRNTVICDALGKLTKETLANARLIAAAPEMLALLRDVLDWYAHSTDADGDMPPELHARLIRAVGGEVATDWEVAP